MLMLVPLYSVHVSSKILRCSDSSSFAFSIDRQSHMIPSKLKACIRHYGLISSRKGKETMCFAVLGIGATPLTHVSQHSTLVLPYPLVLLVAGGGLDNISCISKKACASLLTLVPWTSSSFYCLPSHSFSLIRFFPSSFASLSLPYPFLFPLFSCTLLPPTLFPVPIYPILFFYLNFSKACPLTMSLSNPCSYSFRSPSSILHCKKRL